MIPRIVFGTQYMLPIKSIVFDLILITDELSLFENNTLYNKLGMLMGVSGAGYNMLTGDYIYLTIEDEYDNGETWDLIGDMISEYIGDEFVH